MSSPKAALSPANSIGPHANSPLKQSGSHKRINEETGLLKSSLTTSPKVRPLSPPDGHKVVAFKKAIVGDIFGSADESLAGLMYRSRVLERDNSVLQSEIKEESTSFVDSIISSVEVIDTESDSDNELKLIKRMNPKQQLALTIKNWSVSSENDHHLIKEGAVYALIALSSMDDSSIRRCCASSFYHLSSRAGNREELLNIGTTGGVVKLATLHARSWKVAKLCSLTLCNLSMQEKGEATMATEGAINALGALMSIKGQSLLPICVQALFNMTCAVDHFKELERIIKSLLNITSSGFDHSDFLVKALVNCSRYSWMRMRIIEDGALNCINSLLPTIYGRENRVELCYNVLVAIRSLSESSGCRAEMLTKGTVDIVNNLLGHVDDKGKLLVIKIIHNFLQLPATSSAMNAASFETSVAMVAHIVHETTLLATLQYCAACTHIFTKLKERIKEHMAVQIIDAMSILLRSKDPLTQYFAISTSGNLFFNNLCNNQTKIELLVKNFVHYGPDIKDPAANQALALALAKLSQEDVYMTVIEKLGLLKSVMELLMSLLEINKDSLLLQESCCIAICRIALKVESLDVADKQRIAGVFLNMLEADDQYVLGSTISGIRALGSSGLCHKELLSEVLLNRVATIVARYSNETELCRTGCAVLAAFSYDSEAHDMLAAENVMNVLFANIRAEDGVTKELVANTLCNVSVNSHASDTMIRMGVVEVLATLASSTSENILELCAKCICNLTCNISLHRKMIDNKVLEIILMISLVRTVNNSTKLICAKALLNLITDDNLPAIEASGSVRIFATLSNIQNAPIQHICAKGLYLFTISLSRRQELVQRRAVLQALFNMVKCASQRTRIKVGTSVCNLLACTVTNKAAIKAGALSVIKIIATMEFEELREASARVIISLATDPSLHPLLLGEPIVQVLVLILQKSSDYTFECAIFALSCLSKSREFWNELIDKGAVTALIGCIIAGKVATPYIAEEVCRCICHLSYNYDKAEGLVSSGHLFLALHAVYLSGLCSADTTLLIALTMRNISESLSARKSIIQQSAFRLLVQVITDFSASRFTCTIIYSSLVVFMHNLSLVPMLHEPLLNQGFMRILKKICLYGEHADEAGEASLIFRKDPSRAIIKASPARAAETPLYFTRKEVDYISKTINFLSQTASCHLMIVEGGCMRIFKSLINGLSEESRNDIASALANISGSKSCRELLVNQGATELLIALSITSDANTQSQCALALGYLSELTKVTNGEVASLLLLSLNLEEYANPTAISPTALPKKESTRDVTTPSSLNLPPLPSGAAAAAAANTGAKSLQQMIKELVVDKKRFEQYLELLRNKNTENLDANDFVPHAATLGSSSQDGSDHLTSKLLVRQENGKLIGEEEQSVLVCLFLKYQYDIIVSAEVAEPESGGMSVKSLVELPLPGIPSDRDLEAVDRHDELTTIPVSKEPLPKNFRKPHPIDHTKAQLDVLHSDSVHATSASVVGLNATQKRAGDMQNKGHYGGGGGGSVASGNQSMAVDSMGRRPLLKPKTAEKSPSKSKKAAEPVQTDNLPGAAWNKR